MATFTKSMAPLKTVQEIQFGLFSPEEIKNMSVCHIEYPETMDEQRHRPREKGLNDPKLGTIDRGQMCATCGESQQDCPGHFGHIELAVPVFHVGFITKIKKILESVCHNCGKILSDESNPSFKLAMKLRDPKRRFEAVTRICKSITACQADDISNEDGGFGDDPKKPKAAGHGGCGNVQPTIRKEQLKLNGTWKVKSGENSEEDVGVEKRQITPQMAMNVFRNISEDDLVRLGLNADYARPEWMILTVLPVPPPAVRPSISVDGTSQGMRSEDDLTYKLSDIIRANSNVRRCEQEGSKEELGAVEWHPVRPFVAATGLESGRIYLWSIKTPQRWSALAPDFVEVEENEEYIEKEDEFDLHDTAELQKRRLDQEDEEVDVLTVDEEQLEREGRTRKAGDSDEFRMPVLLDMGESDSEDEIVAIGTGQYRRKSTTQGDEMEFVDGDDIVNGDVETNGHAGTKRRRGD